MSNIMDAAGLNFGSFMDHMKESWMPCPLHPSSMLFWYLFWLVAAQFAHKNINIEGGEGEGVDFFICLQPFDRDCLNFEKTNEKGLGILDFFSIFKGS